MSHVTIEVTPHKYRCENCGDEFITPPEDGAICVSVDPDGPRPGYLGDINGPGCDADVP